jgi:hypothetical protein
MRIHRSSMLFVFVTPVRDEIDDTPAPRPSFVDLHKTPALVLWRPAFSVRCFEDGDCRLYPIVAQSGLVGNRSPVPVVCPVWLAPGKHVHEYQYHVGLAAH